MWAFGVIISALFFFIEIKIIPKLNEENKFKKWWRKNVVGIYNGADF